MRAELDAQTGHWQRQSAHTDFLASNRQPSARQRRDTHGNLDSLVDEDLEERPLAAMGANYEIGIEDAQHPASVELAGEVH
jgi:hypothetical protein